MSQDGSEVTLQFTLKAGRRTSQFATLAADFPGQEAFSRIRFTGSASRPLRISVQLRYAASGGARWGTSVYMDQAERQNEVHVADMGAADGRTGSAADTVRATSLLFVVDLTNARPGDTGSFRLYNLSFGR